MILLFPFLSVSLALSSSERSLRPSHRRRKQNLLEKKILRSSKHCSELLATIVINFATCYRFTVLGIKGLPDAFHMGYEVLVDKDRLANKLPLPKFTGFRETRPSEGEFHSLINEFWFEAYHVAKYLYRRDLWSVQFRLSGIYHSVLIKMICWNEAARHNWEYTTHPNGKQLKNWVGKDTWTAIHHIFPHFDAKEGWQSLRELLQLFIKLSHETSKFLGYRNLTNLETEMDLFITELEAKQMQ